MTDTAVPPAPAAGLEQARQLLRGRRTVHDFLATPVPESMVRDAIEVARWAPNHHRTEPWRFYVIGAEARARIAALNAEQVRAKKGPRAAEIKLARWLAVPGWLLLTCARSDDPRRAQEDYAACCCAAQNFMLYLWAAGIGVKWTTGDVTRHPQFHATLELDPGREQVVGLFWYGWPASVGEQRRRAVDTVMSHID